MKTFKKMHAQGDVMLMVVPASSVPKSAKPVERGAQGHVVAHSETGHHHIVRNAGVTMYEDPGNPLVAYLKLEAGSSIDVEHVRSYDQHEQLRHAGGGERSMVIAVRRQREWAPEGWRRAVD
jgi:hypothetical protein